MRKLLVFTTMLLLVVGCGSTKPHSKSDVPKWYLNPPKDKNKFYAVGDAMRPQLNLSKKIATSRARDELARQIKTEVRSKLNDYQKASGLGMDAEASEFNEYVSGNVVNMSLEYSVIEETDVRDGRVFVLVSWMLRQLPRPQKNQHVIQQNVIMLTVVSLRLETLLIDWMMRLIRLKVAQVSLLENS